MFRIEEGDSIDDFETEGAAAAIEISDDDDFFDEEEPSEENEVVDPYATEVADTEAPEPEAAPEAKALQMAEEKLEGPTCPITLTPLTDLDFKIITADDGQTYHEPSLMRAYQSDNRSPITRENLTPLLFTEPSIAFKKTLEALKAHKELRQKTEKEKTKLIEQLNELQNQYNMSEAFVVVLAHSQKEQSLARLQETKTLKSENNRLSNKVGRLTEKLHGRKKEISELKRDVVEQHSELKLEREKAHHLKQKVKALKRKLYAPDAQEQRPAKRQRMASPETASVAKNTSALFSSKHFSKYGMPKSTEAFKALQSRRVVKFR